MITHFTVKYESFIINDWMVSLGTQYGSDNICHVCGEHDNIAI